MGNIRTAHPVKYFAGCIYNRPEKFDRALSLLENILGQHDLISEEIIFDYTDYYNREMGEKLFRRFISFQNLLPPEILPDIKTATNGIEENLGITTPEGLRREINIDPGYITLAKLILASTKDYGHRIYIGKGIYAEATLYWTKGEYRFMPWTYPDYRTEKYLDFFRNMRSRMKEQTDRAKTENRQNERNSA